LDSFLSAWAKDRPDAFAFRLTGNLAEAHLHVVDLPPGREVHSPDDAHEGQKSYVLKDLDAELLGFFSTRHKAVFTHHDTNIHLHLITIDRKWMGHLEGMHMDPRRVVLFVPE
jgi:acetolactate decarboxylase